MSEVKIMILMNGQRFEREATGEENVRAAFAAAREFTTEAVDQAISSQPAKKKAARKGAKAQRRGTRK